MGVSGQDAERRFEKRKQAQERSREPVFVLLWSCIHVQAGCLIRISKLLLISTLEVEPCDTQKQEPGRALADASITGDGFFEY